MPLYVLPFPAFDPVLISFGPIAIRWYALAYIVGILLGWLYARAIIRRERLWSAPMPMTVSDYDDFGAATSPAPAPFAPAARRAYSEHDGQRQETAGRRVGEENYP